MRYTKAERIFDDTVLACRLHIKEWGFKTTPDGKAIGFNSLETEDVVCTRTLNAIDKLIDSAMERNEFARKHGYDTEYTKIGYQALLMARSTVENVRAEL